MRVVWEGRKQVDHHDLPREKLSFLLAFYPASPSTEARESGGLRSQPIYPSNIGGDHPYRYFSVKYRQVPERNNCSAENSSSASSNTHMMYCNSLHSKYSWLRPSLRQKICNNNLGGKTPQS